MLPLILTSVWSDPQNLTAANFNKHVAAGCYGIDATEYVIMAGLIDGVAGTITDYFGGINNLTDNGTGDYTVNFDAAFDEIPICAAQAYDHNASTATARTAEILNPTTSDCGVRLWNTEPTPPVLFDDEILFLAIGKYATTYWQDNNTKQLKATDLNVMVAGGEYDTELVRIGGTFASYNTSIVTISSNYFGMRGYGSLNADGSWRQYYRGMFANTPIIITTSAHQQAPILYNPFIMAVNNEYLDIEMRNQTADEQHEQGDATILVVGV